MTAQPIDFFDHLDSVSVLGVRVHLLGEAGICQYIADVVAQQRKILVLNVNTHCYNMVYYHPWLRDFLNQAGLVFCDGAGVVLGARILGYHIPGRSTPADSMWRLAALAEEKGISFFFLGAKPGIADKAALKLKERFPALQIATRHGYFDKSPDSRENEEVIRLINASKANVLIVGFGMPLQEKWLKENWERLNVNVGFSAGALFDYISGELRRGPRWMTDNGMEWLARLLIEPKRLWKRYLIGNLFFFCLIFKQWFGNFFSRLRDKLRSD
jgi:N-acetylglucosaminyldiphosphoundecaprenol N-acetyl-beta-D-mannosaminyltransferase